MHRDRLLSMGRDGVRMCFFHEELPVFERFSDQARHVVALSLDEARMLGHDRIGTEHVLLGLIAEGEGVAASALRALKIDAQEVRSHVAEIIGDAQRAPATHLPFTPRAKKVVELSPREAAQLGNTYVGTEHILLALVREGQGGAVRVLLGQGVQLNQVRQQVLQLLASSGAHVLVPREGDRRETDPLRAEVDRLRRLLRRHNIDPDETENPEPDY